MNLYVTDLDGTLLNESGVLSEISKQSLIKLLEMDVQITIASARSIQSIQKILQGVPIKLPVVAFNGSYVSNINTCEHYVVNAIEYKTSRSLFNLLKQWGVLTSLHSNGLDSLVQSGPLSKGSSLYIEDRKRDLKTSVKSVNSLNSTDDVMAYTVIDTKEKIDLLKDQLKQYEHIIIDSWEDMYYKPWHWMSIHSKQSTKANGIKAMTRLVNKEDNKVIVFGDNTNDIEMFSMSDESFAVKNAVDVLKQHASSIIGHHNEDSVVIKIAALEEIKI